jgi:hypothetical protein
MTARVMSRGAKGLYYRTGQVSQRLVTIMKRKIVNTKTKTKKEQKTKRPRHEVLVLVWFHLMIGTVYFQPNQSVTTNNINQINPEHKPHNTAQSGKPNKSKKVQPTNPTYQTKQKNKNKIKIQRPYITQTTQTQTSPPTRNIPTEKPKHTKHTTNTTQHNKEQRKKRNATQPKIYKTQPNGTQHSNKTQPNGTQHRPHRLKQTQRLKKKNKEKNEIDKQTNSPDFPYHTQNKPTEPTNQKQSKKRQANIPT